MRNYDPPKTTLANALNVALSEPNQPNAVQTKPDKLLRIATIAELLTHTFPKREPVLAPAFTLGSLNMVFSQRGIGKTHTALGIAYAGASGNSFWTWTASRPFKTLYIDGEMPGEALQIRLAEIVKANEKEPGTDYFRLLTIDLNEGQMPDLSTLNGQIAIEDYCLDAELIIVDNLSCLCRSGRENEAESWLSIGEWAMRMRSLGKCVIFIHHAGKNNLQRGTSKREDILDVVLELKRPVDYQADQGARFTVNFTKARHLSGNDTQSFEAMLMTIDGKQTWTTKPASESTFDQVVELANLGLSQTDIAKELDINKSNVCRHLKTAKEKGLITEKPRATPGRKSAEKRADIDD
jgi:AAA domain/MarR family